jgi:hypothetical protein
MSCFDSAGKSHDHGIREGSQGIALRMALAGAKVVVSVVLAEAEKMRAASPLQGCEAIFIRWLSAISPRWKRQETP